MTLQSPHSAAATAAAGEGEQGLDPAALVGKRVGNYVIERPLARGGMGSVFVAKHPHLGREVAVKFLDLEVSSRPDLAQRFLSEARITASLHHPNIVDIFDFGDLDGRLYYVMELLRGPSLRAHMRARAHFSPEELLPYMQQICSALDAAHGAGVVHRDLKPANVLLLDGEPPRLKLLDFGVAKMMSTGGTQTQSGQVLGTPSHMAPEQAMGDVHLITPKTDIYSLGVILYEMLTGSPPFRHESAMMLMIMHVRDAVTPVRELAPEVPERVARVIEACLAKAPEARPESARVLSELLSAAVRHGAPGPGVARAADGQGPFAPVAPPHRVDVGSVSLLGTQPTVMEPTAVSFDPVPKAQAQEPAGAPDREAATGVFAFEPVRAHPAARTAPRPEPDAPRPSLTAAVNAPAAVREPAAAVVQLVPVATRTRATASPATAPVDTPSPQPDPVLESTPPAPGERDGDDDAPLTATAQATLSKLLLRLQLKGDFPAFARSMGEVSQKADARSAYSAGQLGQSILKDYALTAKLLRVVNSTYANRFGGKIYSVQHAIVILGFDRIRSLALGISLFKSGGKSGQSQRISDSAIGSLVSGEIARALARKAELEDEEVMVCAMFRNLGHHLTVVYLPESYDEIQGLARAEKLSVPAAAERVLGTSFGRLGAAVAQNWHLPPRIRSAIAAVPSSGGPLVGLEARSNALSQFANELCEIVTNESPSTRSAAITRLLARYKNLLVIDEEAILKLLTSVQESFQQRYSAVFGPDIKASRFLSNVVSMAAGDSPPAANDGGATAAVPERKDEPARASKRSSSRLHAVAPAVGAPKDAVHAKEAKARHKVVVAPLVLGKKLEDPRRAGAAADPPGQSALEKQIEDIKGALAARSSADAILGRSLRLWAQHLGATRLLLLAAAPNKEELIVRAGIRDDLETLTKELRLSLKVGKAGGNVFQATYATGKDITVRDAFTEAATASVPARYYEALGSAAFVLYGCGGRGLQSVVLLVDVESEHDLPPPERVPALARLRPLIAQAISRL
jgi:HD-like signal output (HDOD) protein